MRAALELSFDPAADAAIRALWRQLDAAGVPSLGSHGVLYMPHVSLAVLEEFDPAGAEALAYAAEDCLSGTLNLLLTHVGAFPGGEGVLFLGVTVSRELMDAHHQVQTLPAVRGSQPNAYYLPGAWTPHCTVAIGASPSQLASGLLLCRAELPLTAAAEAVNVVAVPSGEVLAARALR